MRSLVAVAEDKPCIRNKDGSITCSEKGMKTLTDAVLDLRAKVEGLEAKKEALEVDKVQLKHILQTCRDALAAVPPPPNPKKVLLGYGLGVVSAGLLATSGFLDVTPALKASMAGVAVAGVSVGYSLVMP